MANSLSETIQVQIIYALPGEQGQNPISLDVAAGSTVLEAIKISDILKKYPEIDLAVNRIGIFSKLVRLENPVQDGDRIEIYRPLMIDPKERRRQRAGARKR